MMGLSLITSCISALITSGALILSIKKTRQKKLISYMSHLNHIVSFMSYTRYLLSKGAITIMYRIMDVVNSLCSFTGSVYTTVAR